MDTHLVSAALPLLGWALHGGLLARRLDRARRDPLTGLHTRHGWTTRAERLTARHPHAVVLLVDLDDFKHLNDTYGHPAGDAALTATAHRLTRWCGHHGLAARLGGDEFAALVTDPRLAPELDALRDELNQPITYDGHTIPLAASLGACATNALPVRLLGDALAAADAAMYADKGHYRRNR